MDNREFIPVFPDSDRRRPHRHGVSGVNGFFYDGSARWISSEEVLARYPLYAPDPTSNTYPLGGRLQQWARNYATPAKP